MKSIRTPQVAGGQKLDEFVISAEPNATLAGMMLETSFARFVASMTAFNKETVLSRHFGRCNAAVVVEIQGSHD